jgi:alkaline phosphatase D
LNLTEVSLMDVRNDTAARIAVSNIPSTLEYMYSDPKRRAHPILLIGSTGVGKTDTVYQFAEAMGLKLYVIHSIHMEEWEVMGLPSLDHDAQIAKFYPLTMWPFEDKSVLLLDEINRGTVGVLNALMEVVLRRKVGEHQLPDDLMIVAAGNEPGAGSQTTPMSAPMVARFLPFRVFASVDGWIEWAAKNGVHHHVLSFIEHKREILNKEDDNATRRVEACPNPRNWAKLSDILNGSSMKRETEQALVTSAVGAGAATEFLLWRDLARKLPTAADIISGKAKMPGRDRADAQAVVAASVGSYIVARAQEADSTKERVDIVRDLLSLQVDREWDGEPVILCWTVLKSALTNEAAQAAATCREWQQAYSRDMIEALAAF